MEVMKKQFLEVQRQLGILENIVYFIVEKDEIIVQLEEKLIENDKRYGELSDDFQVEVVDNEEF